MDPPATAAPRDAIIVDEGVEPLALEEEKLNHDAELNRYVDQIAMRTWWDNARKQRPGIPRLDWTLGDPFSYEERILVEKHVFPMFEQKRERKRTSIGKPEVSPARPSTIHCVNSNSKFIKSDVNCSETFIYLRMCGCKVLNLDGDCIPCDNHR
jgi:hypothetical protein